VAPAIELPGAAAGRIETHGLEEYVRNGWAVVLVFYPFDFHPDCTTQLCTLRDAEALSLVEDTVVLGVSTDSAYSHQAFSEEYRIEFPLLSDDDGSVANAYGVLTNGIGGHRQVARAALFVVGPDRTIRYAWQRDGPGDSPDMDAVEEAAQGGSDTELPDGKSYL